MRTTVFMLPGLLLGAAALVPGCKWTEFDDLEDQTTVSSTEKPSSDSTDFGMAIGRGARTSTSGGKLFAFGSSEVMFHQLSFASNGDVDVSSGQNITEAGGAPALDAQPILLADPASDEISLVTSGAGSEIDVWHGPEDPASPALRYLQQFNITSPDAATYMVPPPALAAPATDQKSQVLTASGDSVYGANLPSVLQTLPKCTLQDETNTAVQIRGLGAVKLAATGATDPHDVVVWAAAGATGKLILYPGAVFNGFAPRGPCGTQAMPTIGPLANTLAVTTPFVPGKGSQIIMLEDRYALLVGHKDANDPASFLALYDLRAMQGANYQPAMIGTPISTPELRTAAVMEMGADTYVIAGYPTATVDSVKAGQVLAYKLDRTAGLDPQPALTLYDASPESGQQFGRAVAVMQFNGKPIIAVGADNEVFVYFRTALYDETRQ